MPTLIYSKHEVREARSPKIEIVKLSFGPTHRLAKKLERNVLLEPAAAMNQMLVLNCFINVDTSMISEIIHL